MQVAGDSLVRLVDRGRDALQQDLPRGVHLLEPLRSLLEVGLGVLELPHQARRKASLLQHPGVLARKSVGSPRVVRGDQAQTLVAGAPRHGDRALDIESVEHVLEVARIIRPGGSKHEVVEYDPTCHVVLIGAGRHRMQSAEKLVVDAVSPRERNQHSLVAELPEEHSGGDHELGDAARQAAIEVGEIVPGSGMTRDRKQGVDRGIMRLLHTLRAQRSLFVDETLSLAAVQVGPEVHQRIDHLLAPLIQLSQGQRRSDLVGEGGERALLDRGVAGRAGDAEHAQRLASSLQRLGTRRTDHWRGRVGYAGPGGVGRRRGNGRCRCKDPFDLVLGQALHRVARHREDVPPPAAALTFQGEKGDCRPGQRQSQAQRSFCDFRHGLETSQV